MVTKVVFLLAVFGLVSSSLPQRRMCDPEPVRETPTHCSNYRNIVHLDNVQTNLEQAQMTIQQRIDAINDTFETRLEAMKTEFEAKLKKIQDAPQITFSASLAESGEIYRGPSKDKILVFKRVFSNTGGYNQTTGIFTAPVNGFYYFSFSTYGYNTHTTGAILMKNGVRQISTYEYPTADGSDTSSNSAVLQLAAGDKVYMELWDNGRVFDNLNGHTTFSGFLVFPV